MTNALVLLGVMLLFSVSLAILIAVSGDKRRHRLGATLLPVWCVSMLIIYGLRVLDADLDLPFGYVRANIALGLVITSWALLDVSRLARQYGTTTMLRAADVAKGMMLSHSATAAAWAHWARHLPAPAWLKSPDGMLAINRAYESRYGKPPEGYIGEGDGEVWDDDVAARYGGNDAIVIKTRTVHQFMELAPTADQPLRVGEFIKFPVYDARGRIIGVGGIEVNT